MFVLTKISDTIHSHIRIGDFNSFTRRISLRNFVNYVLLHTLLCLTILWFTHFYSDRSHNWILVNCVKYNNIKLLLFP